MTHGRSNAKTLYTHRPLNKYYAWGPGLMLSTKLHFQPCCSLRAARMLQHRMHTTHAASRCSKMDVTPSQSGLTTHKILNKRRVKWWLVYRTRSSVIFIGPRMMLSCNWCPFDRIKWPCLYFSSYFPWFSDDFFFVPMGFESNLWPWFQERDSNLWSSQPGVQIHQWLSKIWAQGKMKRTWWHFVALCCHLWKKAFQNPHLKHRTQLYDHSDHQRCHSACQSPGGNRNWMEIEWKL